jgi:chemotaxis protein methyltransferase CheR
MLNEEQLNTIIKYLRDYSPFDISDYAKGSLFRRFQRVMINQRIDYLELINRIKSDLEFCKNLLEDITVNTTELFRDPDVWVFLRTHTIPLLQKRKSINIWISGCSTGQEAYSIAILLNEMNLLSKTRIFATDINTKVLDVARKGEYKYRNNLSYLSNFNKVIRTNPLNFDENYTVNYDKYFSINKSQDTISMHDFLRKKIVFMQNDLVYNPELPFATFDLISCRNVLIYLNQDLQNRILSGFSKNLRPSSFLLLGVHESIIGPAAIKFTKKGKLYVLK